MRAAALAITVLAGTPVTTGALGPAAAALAAPAPGADTVSSGGDGGAGVAVWPRPQSLRSDGARVPVTDVVALTADAEADPYALEALRALLGRAGARRIDTLTAGERPPAGALVVRATTEEARPDSRHGLPSGGYRLSVARGAVSLAGVGPDGLFHAVQTLRQLARPDEGTLTAAQVRDWPGTAVRGVAEGFYGTPWTHRERLAQLDFLGRTKQNRYLYAPGDDPYRQARWREPYPDRQRARFRELAERARSHHVTLAWAVSPGQAMCFSSDADVRALTRKLDDMRESGFRAFQLQFQDVSYSEWNCGADAERFGSGPGAAARAQAHVANAVARHLAGRGPAGAAELTVMPTEYYQDGPTEYRRALADALDDGVRVAWTGVGVVPRTITGRELAEARGVFGRPLVTVDNYPVNDYAPDRLFLGPYQGREPAVATGSAALLANAMEQPRASRIPLFTSADYAWNPRAYRPEESWRAAIDDLAGGDGRSEEALAALAGNDASSVLGTEESAYLRPLIEAFWDERPTGPGTAAARLREEFGVLRELPDRLPGAGRSHGLAAEVAPWADRLARYGRAGTAALDMLRAQHAGDPAAAWTAYRDLAAQRERLDPARVTVGEGVLEPFLRRARKAYEAWAGLDRGPAGAAHGDPAVRFAHARPLETVTVLAEPGTRGEVEIRDPGGDWRRVGALDASGATELAVRRDAGAVRVTGPDTSGVRHLVPWSGAGERASLELTDDAERPSEDHTDDGEQAGPDHTDDGEQAGPDHTDDGGRAPGEHAGAETDAEIGGARRLTARLGSLRPADVRGTLTAKAPEGVEVHVPEGALTVPRGQEVDVPIEVRVAPDTPARSYDVRLAFGGTTRTLTVHAFPRTGGPDLARGGAARSSADETPDFPASAANDGDRRTRWSSPAEDDAWWQVELARPARLGQVVLRWQDAYASAYRIEVSADGLHWRTAASVRDGRGGRQALRMDEEDVRFVRVRGEERATRFGYSLWSVEAYAVEE
ncbi:hyaluronidase [Streptomyces ambofaciens]|uniref:Hyaluronidase n=1 Tax=Streptomyces ambofaciens TaxID=1889 RepID=A0ABM6AYB0_STRAM|nr:beta-N-acetylglucosaminidase domain-containing protein [Streptomyces ambofaciens]ANB06435.1 hyaluronidase [Streptomyces ambofaciens]